MKEKTIWTINFCAWIIVLCYSIYYLHYLSFIISVSVLPWAITLIPSSETPQICPRQRVIEVILFDEKDNVIAKMFRTIAPSIGDSINLTWCDSEYNVEVLAINHQWADNDIIQLKTRRLPVNECDCEYPPLCSYYIGEERPCRYGIVNNIDCHYLKMELD